LKSCWLRLMSYEFLLKIKVPNEVLTRMEALR